MMKQYGVMNTSFRNGRAQFNDALARANLYFRRARRAAGLPAGIAVVSMLLIVISQWHGIYRTLAPAGLDDPQRIAWSQAAYRSWWRISTPAPRAGAPTSSCGPSDSISSSSCRSWEGASSSSSGGREKWCSTAPIPTTVTATWLAPSQNHSCSDLHRDCAARLRASPHRHDGTRREPCRPPSRCSASRSSRSPYVGIPIVFIHEHPRVQGRRGGAADDHHRQPSQNRLRISRKRKRPRDMGSTPRAGSGDPRASLQETP